MQSIKEKFKNFIKKSPISIFLLFLAIILGLIILGNKMRFPEPLEEANAKTEKEVAVFNFSEIPRISVQAEIKKEGILNLVAQKNGIIGPIYAKDGQGTYAGNTLVYISDNNQGGNLSSSDLSIAQRQNEAVEENFDRQKKILDKEKQIIHNTVVSSRADKIQEDVDEKQLSVNKENLDSTREVSDLTLEKARIAESLSRIMAPANGTIEKIFVEPGQFVTIGTPVALFRGNGIDIKLEAQVTADVAALISTEESSLLKIGEKEIEIKPCYISQEATNAFLYSVIFNLSQEYENLVTDGSFLSLNIALDKAISINPFHPLIPLDAIQLTQDKSFVFIFNNGVAESREIKLGQVLGQFVEITAGLNENDQIILNRTVFDGDRITLAQ